MASISAQTRCRIRQNRVSTSSPYGSSPVLRSVDSRVISFRAAHGHRPQRLILYDNLESPTPNSTLHAKQDTPHCEEAVFTPASSQHQQGVLYRGECRETATVMDDPSRKGSETDALGILDASLQERFRILSNTREDLFSEAITEKSVTLMDATHIYIRQMRVELDRVTEANRALHEQLQETSAACKAVEQTRLTHCCPAAV